jgi:hypothetical protein
MTVRHALLLCAGFTFMLNLPSTITGAPACSSGESGGASDLAHTERTFEFIAEGPMPVVAPLFGAATERLWAPDWRPEFVWPAAAVDRPGMVFTITGPHGRAVWMNTVYDPDNGRFQYTYVLAQTMATLITLQLRADGARTHVNVTYVRTSLRRESNALVERMAQSDGRAGPEWAAQINRYLARSKG